MALFKNLTRVGFIGRLGKFKVEFTAGFVEEIIINITAVPPANAAEITGSVDIESMIKQQFVTTSSTLMSSQVTRKKIFKIIVGSTSNLPM